MAAVETNPSKVPTGVRLLLCPYFVTEWRNKVMANNIQLLDETEQNIVIYQWRADQLFADAEGRGK